MEVGFCESRRWSLCAWTRRSFKGEALLPLTLVSVQVGPIFAGAVGLGVASCVNETEWAYPWSFLMWPSLDFREGRTQSPKHWESQHINSSAELNKSAYCVVGCRARCILGTRNKILEISFLSFFYLSLKNLFSPYELCIQSWILKQTNLIMWVRILAMPLGTVWFQANYLTLCCCCYLGEFYN